MKTFAQASSYLDPLTGAGEQITIDGIAVIAFALVPSVLFLVVTISWRMFRGLIQEHNATSGRVAPRKVTQEQVRRWRGRRNADRQAQADKLQRDVEFHKWNSAQNPDRERGPSIDVQANYRRNRQAEADKMARDEAFYRENVSYLAERDKDDRPMRGDDFGRWAV